MKSWRTTFGLMGLILGTLTLTGCNGSSTPASAATVLTLQRETPLAVNLPQGSYSQQTNDSFIFMGTIWIDGDLPHDVISFSIPDQKERWRTTLPATAIQAVQIEDTLFIATGNEDGNGHLIALAVQDGRILWDQPQGDAHVGIGSLDNRLWVNGEAGIFEIDPATGKTLSTVFRWEKATEDNPTHPIALYTDGDRHYLAAAQARDLKVYQETAAGWKDHWQFRAAKRILELIPIQWTGQTGLDLVVLGHSAAYSLQSDGATRWRIDNSDINQDFQSARCGETETTAVFGNPMKGIYLVNSAGQLRAWEMPGGAYKLGIIPLPLPANANFGTTVADLNGDGQDEILSRSIDKLFVFDCQGNPLAEETVGATASAEGEESTLTEAMRTTPLYRPLVVGMQIFVPGNSQIDLFTVKP